MRLSFCPSFVRQCSFDESHPENKKKVYAGIALLILSFGCFLAGVLAFSGSLSISHNVAYGLTLVGGLPFYVSLGVGFIILLCYGINRCSPPKT